ncbi:MAG TPA: hypothetical protein VG274_07440 [Rhizomicrobium sp.]|nr:hypothetical protein [Rhizomicrobium sp.]
MAFADQRSDFAMLRPMGAAIETVLPAIGVSGLTAAFAASFGLSHSNPNSREGVPLRPIQHRIVGASLHGCLSGQLCVALRTVFSERAVERRVRRESPLRKSVVVVLNAQSLAPQCAAKPRVVRRRFRVVGARPFLVRALHIDIVVELARIFAERHDDLRADRADLHGLADVAAAAVTVFIVVARVGARHRTAQGVGQQFELGFHSFFKAPCGGFEAIRFSPGGAILRSRAAFTSASLNDTHCAEPSWVARFCGP